MAYCRVSFYSGTPLFDMWVLSAFNFVCAWPILLLGMFDRDLEKDYVKKNPHLYAAGPSNEHMSLRVTFRWITLVFLHVNVIYYICAAALDSGGATTSAFKGLMSFGDREPGDGDGSGIKVFGTTTFMILNWTLGLKVLYESGSIIVGKWPACTCRENVGEGFWSRVSYTWYGLIYLSILFNLFFVYTYQYIGREGASSFSPFFYGYRSYAAHAGNYMGRYSDGDNCSNECRCNWKSIWEHVLPDSNSNSQGNSTHKYEGGEKRNNAEICP